MYVPLGIRKSVVFIGIQRNKRFLPRATGFLVGVEDEGYYFPTLVTAEHVVSGLLTKNEDIYVRTNLKNGQAQEDKFPAKAWKFHPDETQRTDVAAAPFNPTIEMDIGAVAVGTEFVADQQFLDDYQIGPGDEIAIIGLFRSHYGQEQNVPVVRVGNIAMMAGGEPVDTKYCGFIDAHLVEARSIGGLSGSPVFLSMQPRRMIVGAKKTDVMRPYYLFGLMHGHFDIKNLNLDVATESDTEALGNIHTGMGVVVPLNKILETINHPDLVVERKKMIAHYREAGMTPDLSDDDAHPVSDGKPVPRD